MKKTCEICDGSGQISFFKGVSRFLLSWEDCPECGGMGFVYDSLEEAEGQEGVKGENSQVDEREDRKSH